MNPDEDKWRVEREEMVRRQLESRDIDDERVLDVFRRVPRHLFVPERWRDDAYSDHPLSIGEGQTISQPYIVALMTQRLELKGGEKVLEVGTGSGYQAAVLSYLARHVVSVERIEALAFRAARLLQRVVDLGNGVLQFSILAGGSDPQTWPDYFDGARIKRFLVGYDTANVISSAELRCIPQLMIEALIAEAALPIAATGSFAQMAGFGFLKMVRRKVRWLRENAEQLGKVLAD